jgi:hypothetical protein
VIDAQEAEHATDVLLLTGVVQELSPGRVGNERA